MFITWLHFFPGIEDPNADAESGNSGESSPFSGPPPLDLERIARAYAEQWESDRLAELNPDIENQSSSTLRRPADYESVGKFPLP